MCIFEERECDIEGMIGYVVVIREPHTIPNDICYRSIYRTYYVAHPNVKMEANMIGGYGLSAVGGFHAFKTLKAAKIEKNCWSGDDSVIVECLMENIFSEGMYYIFPTNKRHKAIRAKFRTILKEIVPEEKKDKRKGKKL